MGIYDILVAAGITVQDARVAPRPGPFNPVGLMLHHTADGPGDLPSLHVLQHGRSDLPGPLVQIGAGRAGTIAAVTDGRANHAGAGSSIVLNRVRNDLPPGTTGADDMGMNEFYIGVEIENAGDGHDPYPTVQHDAVLRVGVALCLHYGWTANRVIGHKESTHRKVDPSFDMGGFRAELAAILHPAPSPTHDESELSMLPRLVHFGTADYLVGYDNQPFDGTVRDAQGNVVPVKGAVGPWMRPFPNPARKAQIVGGGGCVTDHGQPFEVVNDQFEQVYVNRGAA